MGRPESVRRSNERIAEQAERLRFVSRVPMLCECSDPSCRRIFLIELERYRAIRADGHLTAPGHTIDGHEHILEEGEYWQHGRGR